MADEDIILEARGSAGVVTLNRPQALNALTHGMVKALSGALDRWEHDSAVTRVVIVGAGGKAFCAGGDIRMLYEAGRYGEVERALAFWRDEYRLNIRIKRYPKPYVALMDGIVMGGGVGVSLHGSHRVAADRYRFAMPEVGIGFFPDVGATWDLARLPGRFGLYIALTGARIGPDDASALGLVTHRVASADLGSILDGLVAGEPVDSVLAGADHSPAPGPVTAERAIVDRCFAKPTIAAILGALDVAAAEGSVFAAETAAAIRGKAPSSLAIAFEQVRRAASQSFEETMKEEFRIVSRVARGRDFYEGVRATILDRDNRPSWEPPSLDSLGPDYVARVFAPLGPDELDTGGLGVAA